jgi:hypothetical protein
MIARFPHRKLVSSHTKITTKAIDLTTKNVVSRAHLIPIIVIDISQPDAVTSDHQSGIGSVSSHCWFLVVAKSSMPPTFLPLVINMATQAAIDNLSAKDNPSAKWSHHIWSTQAVS